MIVAIYSRVSTGKQDYENQLLQLREFSKNKGWKVYEEYSETISGKEADRPEFKRMLEDASKRKFDAIVVWALDRFTREFYAMSAHDVLFPTLFALIGEEEVYNPDIIECHTDPFWRQKSNPLVHSFTEYYEQHNRK